MNSFRKGGGDGEWEYFAPLERKKVEPTMVVMTVASVVQAVTLHARWGTLIAPLASLGWNCLCFL